MHVLLIIDPIQSLKAYKDTSVAMMRSLLARGHQISVCAASSLSLVEGLVVAQTQAITIASNANLHESNWWQNIGSLQVTALKDFSAVLMRKDPPFDMEYIYVTHLFDIAQNQGAKVFNQGQAIRNHPEKLSICNLPQYTAPTIVSSEHSTLKDFHAKHKDIVVKPLDGMGGQGIFRIKEHEVNLNAILELLTNYGQLSIMAQRYIPEIVEGDKRILIIAGKPIPYALARIPLAGETRGNLAAGGRGVAQPLSAHDAKVAQEIGARLYPLGLFLIGLDMIGSYVTEINVTSPTCFVEITEQTGFDVASHFVEMLENMVEQS